jgi:glycosyltransferase involved in cell wall biosynthesis
VLTGGPSLYEAKRHANERVLCLPSAVDAVHFDPVGAASRREMVDRAETLQGAVPHPRLGFYGVIDERIDLDLVQSLADADPAWHLIMVGPVVKIDPGTLPQRPNIHWLGQQSYDVLPQLVAGWDVCLMPFALNESTRFISPTKTLEYMAAGKPVVSTAIHDVISLYGSAVHVGRDTESFLAGCRNALAETATQREERLPRMAGLVAQYSWDRTAQTIHEALQGLGSGTPPAGSAQKAAHPGSGGV